MAAVTNILLKLDGCEIRTAIDSMKTKPYKRKNCPVTLFRVLYAEGQGLKTVQPAGNRT